ncbi:hypothetical protein J2Z79_001670 [Symbiobacterium terraclitae]|uniref:Uncharacterized protein n=1 Tax=Symbiobacterium terraclitae TaxID=557451 RepID=A0ABS4JRV4_9FIRM|nr:hypothetical protein [Symbiobacterium terraclitae]MBP2018269.1 hypothetical protein [Symbiobacterium terraclitae]
MISAVIGIVILGAALLLPNVVALRTAIAGPDERQAARMAAAKAAPARPRRTFPAPKLLRRGYLWKALSPLVFALTVMFGIAIGGTTGYVLMGLGLLNVLLGLWGWGDYVRGQAGKR